MRRWVSSVAILAIGCGDDIASPGDEGSSSSEGTSSTSASTTSGASGSASGASVSTSSGAATSTDDTSSGSADSSSTAAPEACGDGDLGGEEECDDGNTEDGDACSSTCALPFTIAWTQTYDGADHFRDIAEDVAIAEDGSIYVVGTTSVGAQENNIWLRQYAADGTEGWTFTFDGTASRDDFGHGVAVHPWGDIVVVGSTQTDTGFDLLVLRIAEDDQSIVWQQTYDGPHAEVSNIDVALDVAVDLDGGLAVVGYETGLDGSQDMWLGRYDADGEELWHVTHVSAGDDNASDVVVDDLGITWIAGTMDQSNDRYGWLGGYDADGVLVDEVTVPTAFVYGVHQTSDGQLLVCGERPYAGSWDAFTIALDDSLDTVWEALYDGRESGVDGTHGVVSSPDGKIYTAGYEAVAHAGIDADISVARLSADDGARVWSDHYDGGLEDDDRGEAIAVAPDGGIVVVGSVYVMGQVTNAFVRKYVEPR